MKRFLSLSILPILLIASLDANAALGCAIRPGDYWYKVDAEVISNPLSDVLGISFAQNGALITFTNLSLKSNLYIASKDTDGIYPGYREFQRDYRPTEKIIGTDHDPNVQISIGDGLPKGVYTFHGGWGLTRIGDKTTPDSGTVSTASALDSTDNYKTKQVQKDGRPDDAPIPEPDYQTMYAFYEGSQYNIDILLNYSLNDSYIPDNTAKSCEGEGEALMAASRRRQSQATATNYLLSPLSLTGFLIVASISVVLLLKSIEGSKNKKTTRKRTAKPEPKRVRKK